MFLKNAIQTLDHRWTIKSYLPHTSSLIHVLKSLRPTEKDYIADHVTKKEWNLGSPNVLDILQLSGILRMSDFMVVKIESEDTLEVELIFNDLLEIQQLSLLADLIENIDRTDPRSQLVAQCLNDGFRRFLADMSTGAFSLNRNYLHELRPHLTGEQMEKIRILHLKLLLDVSDCSLVEAIAQLSEWMNDMDNSVNNGFNELIREFLFDQEKVVQCLMKKVYSDKFHGWKWYAYVLRTISGSLKSQSVKIIKAFLKDLYSSFLVQKNKNFFLIMIVTARVLCTGDRERFGDYLQWYRNQFSDMRYRISKDDFVSTLEMLQSLVSYENDLGILHIYAATAISPPTLCNDLVLNFKLMCRSKMERLKSDASGDGRTDEVVQIDIDDDDFENENNIFLS
ncbi:hypothetical protein HA402_001895 [Bradysia odoriphaga]|nr:hypothetical protein HA402_001895 [Bradysia odoriphaga]